MDLAPVIGHVTETLSTACKRFSSILHQQSDSKHSIKSFSDRGAVSLQGSDASVSTTTKEEVGRATWTLLHTLAAQYPEHPTSRQKRDARNLIDIMTRMYPCGECAEHFSEVVKVCPPRVDSRHELSQWMCRVHNVVNRSIGKPEFNCSFIASRWEGIDCDTPLVCSLR